MKLPDVVGIKCVILPAVHISNQQHAAFADLLNFTDHGGHLRSIPEVPLLIKFNERHSIVLKRDDDRSFVEMVGPVGGATAEGDKYETKQESINPAFV